MNDPKLPGRAPEQVTPSADQLKIGRDNDKRGWGLGRLRLGRKQNQ